MVGQDGSSTIPPGMGSRLGLEGVLMRVVEAIGPSPRKRAPHAAATTRNAPAIPDDPAADPGAPGKLAAMLFPTGQEVSVVRSSGDLEAGWCVDRVVGNFAWVSAVGMRKRVDVADLLQVNPKQIKTRRLRVQRTSGEFEDDWKAIALRPDGRVLVTKAGLAKSIRLSEILAWND